MRDLHKVSRIVNLTPHIVQALKLAHNNLNKQSSIKIFVVQSAHQYDCGRIQWTEHHEFFTWHCTQSVVLNCDENKTLNVLLYCMQYKLYITVSYYYYSTWWNWWYSLMLFFFKLSNSWGKMTGGQVTRGQVVCGKGGIIFVTRGSFDSFMIQLSSIYTYVA